MFSLMLYGTDNNFKSYLDVYFGWPSILTSEDEVYRSVESVGGG